MAYSQEVLARAQARLAQARQEQQDSYDAHLREAYRRYPRLKEIDCALRTTMAEVVAATFRRGEDPAAAIAAIKAKNQALQEEREWILESSDLDTDFLDDTPFCPKCGGSGYIGTFMCQCLRDLCRREQEKEIALLADEGQHFGAFRLDYYSDMPDPKTGISPRAIMARGYDICRDYAENFTMKFGNLLFNGGTGLGKTFLSACIAREVAARGYSVAYETASHLFAKLEKHRFHPDEETAQAVKRLEDCDLLIVDDLGTELSGQFVTAALYTLLNDRLLAGKPMVISTNLNIEQIGQRYSPQIKSRFQGSFRLLPFVGQDIRVLLNRGY